MQHKIIVITAPSGAGKTTLAKKLLERFPILEFAISCTTRELREGEVEGKDYFQITKEEFEKRKDSNQFLEWQPVYGKEYCYATPRSEIQRIMQADKVALLDIDPFGACNVMDIYGKNVLSIFITVPGPVITNLETRLHARNKNTETDIRTRLMKAIEELAIIHHFNHVVVNDDVQIAEKEITTLVGAFLHT